MSNAAGEAPVPHLVDVTMFWSPTGGGVRRYLSTKHAWLEGRGGWRHTIVVPGAGPAPGGFAHVPGMPLPLSGGYRLPLGRQAAARVIEQLAPDVIEAGDPYRLAWSALDAAARRHVPTVAFCHSNIAALAAHLAGGRGWRAHWARRAAAAYMARTLERFDLVLAPSLSLLHELEALGLHQVQHQPLGVDGAVFRPEAHDSAWRAALGLPAGTRLLLYAGRFAPEKHLPLLVEAVERLGSRYALLAIGDGPLPPRGPRVRVLPYEKSPQALARAIASADAVLHAGDQETFGLGVLEAMACGTPVVASDAGGLSELLAGGAGIGVKSRRAPDWAEAIAAAFTAERGDLIDAGLRRAQAHDWNRVLPSLLQRYRTLLGGGTRQPDERASPPALEPQA